MILCRVPTKPVPFIPVLDDNFDWYFKKDSLWQSEDLAAIVGEDVGRTCILQGPVSVKYSTEADVPVKDILEGVHNGIIDSLLKDSYSGDSKKIPTVEVFGLLPTVSSSEIEEKLESNTLIYRNGTSVSYKISTTESSLPSLNDWIELIVADKPGWLKALLSTDVIVQGTKHRSNQIRQLFAPIKGLNVDITNINTDKFTVSVSELINGKRTTVLVISKPKDIKVEIIDERTVEHKPVSLELAYKFRPEFGFAPIVEVMEDRNERIKSSTGLLGLVARSLLILKLMLPSQSKVTRPLSMARPLLTLFTLLVTTVRLMSSFPTRSLMLLWTLLLLLDGRLSLRQFSQDYRW